MKALATRRERVVLELDDNFTSGMARAAAATALMKREMDGLNGRGGRVATDLDKADRSVTRLGADVERSGNEIDHYSGRLRLLADTAAILGPGLIPIAAEAIPAFAGLANQLGVAALAGGTAVLAFHGLGDALKALYQQRVDPTTAHLKAMHKAMDAIGPGGRDLVRTLYALLPEFSRLQDLAQGGLFPGISQGLGELMARIPDVEQLVASLSDAMGNLVAEGANSLAGAEWDDFFNMLQNEAKPTLTETAHAVGDVAAGLADLWVAFAPLNQDFARGLAGMASSFHQWADGLAQTEGFANFIDYLHQTGPLVLDTLGSLGKALLDIGRAAAPLGGPVLHVIKAFADALDAIARSDLGTPIFTAVAAISAFNRTLAVTQALMATSFASKALPVFKAALAPVISDITTIGTTWMTAGAQSEREMARVAEASGRLRTTLMTNLGKGVEFAAILEGFNLIHDAVEKLANQDLQSSDLGRSLDALATGRTTGEIARVFGGDLHKMADDIDFLGAKWANWPDKAFGWIPLVTTHLEDVQKHIGAVDEQLAQMVESGNGRAAAAAFDQIAEAAKRQGISVGQLRDAFPQYTLAVQNAASTTDRAGSATDRYAGSTDAATRAIDRQNEALQKNIDKMRTKREEALKALGGEIAYQASLDEGADRLKQRADLEKQIADAQRQGAQERADLQRQLGQGGADTGRAVADLQRQLSQAEAERASAKTAAQRKSALEKIRNIQQEIADKQRGQGRDAQRINQEVADSYRREREQVANLRDELKQYDKTLDLNRQAGRDNMQVLIDIATAWNGLNDRQQNAAGAFDKARQALIKQAEQFGATRKEAQRLADRLLNWPTKLVTNVSLETEDARRRVQALRAELKKLSDPISLNLTNVRLSGTGGGSQRGQSRLVNAAGNFFGAGDVANGHAPQIASGGPIRVWAEPETRGEAYIPLADDWRRPRAIDIWERTGQALGVQFARFAGGGMTRTVTVSPQVAAGPGIDYDRLASAMLNARSLYGDVHVHGDGSFRRTLLEDHQRAALGVLSGGVDG